MASEINVVVVGNGTVSSSRMQYVSAGNLTESEKPVRKIFNRDSDELTKRQSEKYLTNEKGYPRDGELFEMFVSPEKGTLEKLGRTKAERENNFKEAIRQGMSEMFKAMGVKEGRYVAGLHQNTNHPHAHIVIWKGLENLDGSPYVLDKLPNNAVVREAGENSPFGKLFSDEIQKRIGALPPLEVQTGIANQDLKMPKSAPRDSERWDKALAYFSEVRKVNPALLENLIANGSLYVNGSGGITFVRRNERGTPTGYTNESGWTGLKDERGYFYIGDPNRATKFILVENPKEALAMWQLTAHRDLSNVCIATADDGKPPTAFLQTIKDRSEDHSARFIWALGLNKDNTQNIAGLETARDFLTEDRNENAKALEIVTIEPKKQFGRTWHNQVVWKNAPGILQGLVKTVLRSQEARSIERASQEFLAVEETKNNIYSENIFERVTTINDKDNRFRVVEKIGDKTGRDLGSFTVENGADGLPTFVVEVDADYKQVLRTELEAIKFIEEVFRYEQVSEDDEIISNELINDNTETAEVQNKVELVSASEVIEQKEKRGRTLHELVESVRDLDIAQVAPLIGLQFRNEEKVWIDQDGKDKNFKIFVNPRDSQVWTDRVNGFKGGRGMLDLVMHVGRMDFITARNLLLDSFEPNWRAEIATGKNYESPKKIDDISPKNFKLPYRGEQHLDEILTYLSDRKIDTNMLAVQTYLNNVYADSQFQSAVFVHRSPDGEITGASWRAITGNKRDDVKESDNKKGWFHIGDMNTAFRYVIVRDPIEALSYYTLNANSKKMRNTAVIALGYRAKDIPVELYDFIKDRVGAELVVALENSKASNNIYKNLLDRAGRTSEDTTNLQGEYIGKIIRELPNGEDWNDQLQAVRYEDLHANDQEHFIEQAEVEEILSADLEENAIEVIATEADRSETESAETINQENETETEPFQWARYAADNENSYDISNDGDRRFNSLNAILVDGRSIEEAFELDIKSYRSHPVISDALNDGMNFGQIISFKGLRDIFKGQPPLVDLSSNKETEKELLASAYKELWRQWIEKNTTNKNIFLSLAERAEGKVIVHRYAAAENSPARALTELLNEYHAEGKLPKKSSVSEYVTETLIPRIIGFQAERIDYINKRLDSIDPQKAEKQINTEDIQKVSSKYAERVEREAKRLERVLNRLDLGKESDANELANIEAFVSKDYNSEIDNTTSLDERIKFLTTLIETELDEMWNENVATRVEFLNEEISARISSQEFIDEINEVEFSPEKEINVEQLPQPKTENKNKEEKLNDKNKGRNQIGNDLQTTNLDGETFESLPVVSNADQSPGETRRESANITNGVEGSGIATARNGSTGIMVESGSAESASGISLRESESGDAGRTGSDPEQSDRERRGESDLSGINAAGIGRELDGTGRSGNGFVELTSVKQDKLTEQFTKNFTAALESRHIEDIFNVIEMNSFDYGFEDGQRMFGIFYDENRASGKLIGYSGNAPQFFFLEAEEDWALYMTEFDGGDRDTPESYSDEMLATASSLEVILEEFGTRVYEDRWRNVPSVELENLPIKEQMQPDFNPGFKQEQWLKKVKGNLIISPNQDSTKKDWRIEFYNKEGYEGLEVVFRKDDWLRETLGESLANYIISNERNNIGSGYTTIPVEEYFKRESELTDILHSYSYENPENKYEDLIKWVEKYPHFRQELIEWSSELSLSKFIGDDEYENIELTPEEEEASAARAKENLARYRESELTDRLVGTFEIEYQDEIKRSDVQANRNKLYIFGDNLEGRGFGGQAKEMRNEPNSFGIPTKNSPSTTADAYFSDSDLKINQRILDQSFKTLKNILESGKYETVVFPSAGLGTGLAKLEEKAPKTYDYLKDKLREIGWREQTPEAKTRDLSDKKPTKKYVVEPGEFKDVTPIAVGIENNILTDVTASETLEDLTQTVTVSTESFAENTYDHMPSEWQAAYTDIKRQVDKKKDLQITLGENFEEDFNTMRTIFVGKKIAEDKFEDVGIIEFDDDLNFTFYEPNYDRAESPVYLLQNEHFDKITDLTLEKLIDAIEYSAARTDKDLSNAELNNLADAIKEAGLVKEAREILLSDNSEKSENIINEKASVSDSSDSNAGKNTLPNAIKKLLAVCDGAHTHDGQGFNGVDAPYARHLGNKENWTRKEAEKANKMLRKYRKQLAGMDIDYDALAQTISDYPESYASQQTRKIVYEPTITGEDEKIVKIIFGYDETLVKNIKEIPSASFKKNGAEKYWTISENAANSQLLIEFAKENEFDLSDEAIVRLSGLIDGTITAEDLQTDKVKTKTDTKPERFVAEVKSMSSNQREADDFLKRLSAEKGFIGGQIFEPTGKGERWTVQSFFEPDTAGVLDNTIDLEEGGKGIEKRYVNKNYLNTLPIKPTSPEDLIKDSTENSETIIDKSQVPSLQVTEVSNADRLKFGSNLIPDRLLNTLPRRLENESTNPEIFIKLFHPLSDWTIFISEIDPVFDSKGQIEDVILFGYTQGFEGEWGYSSLSEIEQIKVHSLGFERDKYFEQGKFDDVIRRFRLERGEIEEEEQVKETEIIEVNETSAENNSESVEQTEVNISEAQDDSAENNADVPELVEIRPDNYRFSDLDIHNGGEKTKFRNNIEAIKVLQTLEEENRFATPEEMDVLAKFVGWGAVKEPFRHSVSQDWVKERDALANLLNKEEFEFASRVTDNAHHTSIEISRKIWEVAEHLGFTGGRIVEPAVGSGNFLGTVPEQIGKNSKFYGSDIDPTSLKVAQALYPRAELQNTPYEKTKWKDNTFDLTITNVPFGNYHVPDLRYKGLNPTIHNYFLLKSLDQTRSGGLVMALTSRYTLDSNDSRIREAMASRAELVGAVRLPNNAFKANAGTEVVTDLLIFKKRETPLEIRLDEKGNPLPPIIPEGELNWLETESIENPNYDPTSQFSSPEFDVNELFVREPERILGKISGLGKMYVRGDMTVEDDGTFEEKWDNWRNTLPQNVYESLSLRESNEIQAKLDAKDWLAEGLKAGNLFIEEDKVFQVESDGAALEIPMSPKNRQKVGQLLEIKETVTEIYRAEVEGTTETLLEAETLRVQLNRQYNDFKKQHGAIKAKENIDLMSGDPDAYRVVNLEKAYHKATGNTEKADIFFRPTITPIRYLEKADNLPDAIAASLNKFGKLDLEYIADLRTSDVQTIKAELIENNLAFETPLHENWETADIYLSGNVKAKLRAAEERASMSKADEERFTRNVDSLREVIPADIPHVEIDINLGSSFMTERDMQDFVSHLTKATENDVMIEYAPKIGRWAVGWRQNQTARSLKKSEQSTEVWGTKDRDVLNLLEAILQGKDVTVNRKKTDSAGNEVQYVDRDATSLAEQKISDIKAEFREWIWKDDSRRTRIHREYNDKRNNMVAWKPNGAHLQLVGLSPNITPYAHQRDYAWRAIQKPSAYAAHEVGTGKTLSMAMAAMEKKRLGQVNKPGILCLKANIHQVTAGVREAYPHARIFSLDEHFNGNSRQDAASIIANNDFDLVIMTYEQLKKLPLSERTQNNYLRKELNVLTSTISDAIESEGKKSRLASQLRRRQRNLEAKIGDLILRPRDNAVTFEETGIDNLYVDEAHNFKALPIYTTLQNLKGVPSTRSERAVDLHMRTEYLREKHGEPRISPATGTPITNTVAELYNWMRFCAPEVLEEAGLESFDAFAREYTEVVRKLEPTATGSYKVQNRLAKYINMPELRNMMSDYFDVVMAEDAGILRPKSQTFVIGVPISPEQMRFRDSLQTRAANLGKVDPRDDNYFKISSDGEKMSMDLRLVDGSASDDAVNKVKMVVANCLRILKEKPGTVQMIFSDIGIHPNPLTGFSMFNDIEESLIAAGVPKERIANISKLSKEKGREAIDKAEKGEVLFLLGSTQRLGTGVNAQTFVSGLHSLDTNWLPSAEEQRRGRGIRQGNVLAELAKSVECYKYVTVGGFDEIKNQANARKETFIKQIVTNNITNRTFQDRSDDGFSPAEIAAVASGNDDVRRQVELSMEVEELSRREKMHRQSQINLRDNLPRLQEDLKIFEKLENEHRTDSEFYERNRDAKQEKLREMRSSATERLKIVKDEIKAMEANPATKESDLDLKRDEQARLENLKEVNFTVKLDGAEYFNKEEAARKLTGIYGMGRYNQTIGEYNGFEMRIERDSVFGNYQSSLFKTKIVLISPETGLKYEVKGESFIEYVENLSYSVSRLNQIADAWGRKADSKRTELKQVEDKVNTPFREIEKLKEYKAELKEIENRLKVFNKDAQRQRELDREIEIFELGTDNQTKAKAILTEIKRIMTEESEFVVPAFVSKAHTEASLRGISVAEVEAMYEAKESRGGTVTTYSDEEADEENSMNDTFLFEDSEIENAEPESSLVKNLREKTSEVIKTVSEKANDFAESAKIQFSLFGDNTDEEQVMADLSVSGKFENAAFNLKDQPIEKIWYMVGAKSDGEGRIKLNPAGYEVVRRAYATAKIGYGERDFGGTFNEPRGVEKIVESLDNLKKADRYYGETYNQVIRTIRQAQRERGGTVTFLRDVSAIAHESLHEGSFYAGKGAEIAERHGFFLELSNSEAMEKAKPQLLAKKYVNNNAILVDELACHIGSGDFLNLTRDEGKAYLRRWFESLAEKNGTLSLKEFKELIDESKNIRDEVYQRRLNEESAQANGREANRSVLDGKLRGNIQQDVSRNGNGGRGTNKLGAPEFSGAMIKNRIEQKAEGSGIFYELSENSESIVENKEAIPELTRADLMNAYDKAITDLSIAQIDAISAGADDSVKEFKTRIENLNKDRDKSLQKLFPADTSNFDFEKKSVTEIWKQTPGEFKLNYYAENVDFSNPNIADKMLARTTQAVYETMIRKVELIADGNTELAKNYEERIVRLEKLWDESLDVTHKNSVINAMNEKNEISKEILEYHDITPQNLLLIINDYEFSAVNLTRNTTQQTDSSNAGEIENIDKKTDLINRQEVSEADNGKQEVSEIVLTNDTTQKVVDEIEESVVEPKKAVDEINYSLQIEAKAENHELAEMLGDEILKRIEIRQTEHLLKQTEEKAENQLHAIINENGKEEFHSLKSLDRKASFKANAVVAEAVKTGVVSLKVYQSDKSENEVKREIRQSAFESVVIGQSDLRSQINSANEKALEEINNRLILQKEELFNLEDKTEKYFKMATPEVQENIVPFIKPEILYKEQEIALKRGDAEAFALLEEVHRSSGDVRPNYAVARLTATAFIAETNGRLSDYRAEKLKDSGKEKSYSFNVKQQNGSITVEEWSEKTVNEKTEKLQNSIGQSKNRAYRELFKWAENKINPLSNVQGSVSWFTDPKGTFKAHFNPIEVIKNDPAVQIVRGVYNFAKGMQEAKLAEMEVDRLGKIKTNIKEMFEDELSEQTIAKNSFTESSELAKKSIESEKTIRQEKIEELGEEELFNAENLKMPKARFTNNEIREIQTAATEMQDVELVQKVLNLVEQNPTLAESLGSSAERQFGQAVISKLEANAKLDKLFDANIEGEAVNVKFSGEALDKIGKQLDVTSKADEWIKNLLTENPALEADFTPTELERLNELQEVMSEPVKAAVKQIIDKKANQSTEKLNEQFNDQIIESDTLIENPLVTEASETIATTSATSMMALPQEIETGQSELIQNQWTELEVNNSTVAEFTEQTGIDAAAQNAVFSDQTALENIYGKDFIAQVNGNSFDSKLEEEFAKSKEAMEEAGTDIGNSKQNGLSDEADEITEAEEAAEAVAEAEEAAETAEILEVLAL